MQKEKRQPVKEKDAWYLVTSEGKTVAMVLGKESAKAVYSGGDSPLDKFENFEDAYREFKKRWKGVPKGKRGRRNISLEETWYFLLTKDELVAVVIGFLECEKILMHYIYMTGGGLRKVSASTYTQLIREIDALRENKWPHEGILKGSLLKPGQKKNPFL